MDISKFPDEPIFGMASRCFIKIKGLIYIVTLEANLFGFSEISEF
jgi:hypothetical protein